MWTARVRENSEGKVMKSRNERDVVLSPAREDSGLATSGEIGELSFSGECEGVVCPQEPRSPERIEEDENQDPRSDLTQSTVHSFFFFFCFEYILLDPLPPPIN